ncbi:MAG: class I SAM-dependent methyltransferase [Sphingomonas sp.]
MIEAARERIAGIEQAKPPLEQALAELRKLSLEEFGELLLTLPDPGLPHLSSLLPHATPDSVQKEWTGSAGIPLLRQSVSFVSFLAAEYTTQTGRPLADAQVLDFGVGWGRLMRLLPFFADPEKLHGVDPWESSLGHARAARLLGRVEKSQVEPAELPFPEVRFELIYAFSVFTHLSSRVAAACLAAMRKRVAPDGIAVITLRPAEFWPYLAQQRGRDYPEQTARHAADGYAFVPASDGANYGDTSMSEAYLKRIAEGWEIARMGVSFIDPYQVFVTLRPAA